MKSDLLIENDVSLVVARYHQDMRYSIWWWSFPDEYFQLLYDRLVIIFIHQTIKIRLSIT